MPPKKTENGPKHPDELLVDPRAAHNPADIRYAENAESPVPPVLQAAALNVPQGPSVQEIADEVRMQATPESMPPPVIAQAAQASQPQPPQIPELVSTAAEAPALAPQSAKGVWGLLGARAADPAPGEQFTGKPAKGEKAKAVINGLDVLSGVMEAVGNGPRGAEISMQRQKLRNDAVASENDRDYRRAQEEYYRGRNQATVDAAQARAGAMSDKSKVEALKNGLIYDDALGTFRTMTEEEINQSPMLQSKLDAVGAKKKLDEARAAEASARADYLKNPNNAKLKMEHERAQAMLAMAARRMQLSEHNSDRSDDVFERDTFGTRDGVPIPGAIEIPGGNGQTVGPKFAGRVAPTTAQRDQAGQAEATHQTGIDLKKFLIENKKVVGPIMGRYNSFKMFLGDPNPAVAKLNTLMKSYAALNPAMHKFRSMQAAEAFEHALGGFKYTPEALIASIEGIEDTAVNLIREGETNYVGKPKEAARHSMTEIRSKGEKVMFQGKRSYSLNGEVYDAQTGEHLGHDPRK
jgi:hypothetical protein